MLRRLEHLSCKDRLKELGLFRLEKRMLQEDLTEVFQYLKGVEKKRERDLLHGQVMTGQGTMVLN